MNLSSTILGKIANTSYTDVFRYIVLSVKLILVKAAAHQGLQFSSEFSDIMKALARLQIYCFTTLSGMHKPTKSTVIKHLHTLLKNKTCILCSKNISCGVNSNIWNIFCFLKRKHMVSVLFCGLQTNIYFFNFFVWIFTLLMLLLNWPFFYPRWYLLEI